MQQQVSPGQLAMYLEKSTAVECDKCGNDVFEEATKIRIVSKFVTFTDKDSMIPIPVFVCKSCGHINEQFIPDFMKTKIEE